MMNPGEAPVEAAMRIRIRQVFMLITGLVLVSLSGCWLSSSNPTVLGIGVADTPIDGAESVIVTFTGVQVTDANNKTQEFDFTAPQNVNLLDPDDDGDGDGLDVLLRSEPIAAGHYLSMRFLVDMNHSNITLSDGSVHPLVLTTTDQTGITVATPFDVLSENENDYVADFDLRASIALVSGTYDFTPVTRLVNNATVGAIGGHITNTFPIGSTVVSDPSCDPAVYIYSGADVTPVDIAPGQSVQPVATATVSLDSVTGDYRYFNGFMPPGTYTVALVCASGDDPTTLDNLTFAEPQTAPVTAGFFTEVTFP